jgi:hypothetical protein
MNKKTIKKLESPKFINKPPLELVSNIIRNAGIENIKNLTANAPFTIKDLKIKNILTSLSPYLNELNQYYEKEYRIDIINFSYINVIIVLEDVLPFKNKFLYTETIKVKRNQIPYQKFHIVKPEFFFVSEKTEQEVIKMKKTKKKKFIVDF